MDMATVVEKTKVSMGATYGALELYLAKIEGSVV